MGNDPQVNPALVVIPTYNERRNLPPLVERILSLEPPFDVLVVEVVSVNWWKKVRSHRPVELIS